MTKRENKTNNTATRTEALQTLARVSVAQMEGEQMRRFNDALEIKYVQNGEAGAFKVKEAVTLLMLIEWQQGNMEAGNYDSITILRNGEVYSKLEAFDGMEREELAAMIATREGLTNPLCFEEFTKEELIQRLCN